VTPAEMPLHVHGLGLAVSVNAGVNYVVPSAGVNSYDSLNAGGNVAHNNVQPTIILNYIIRI
jgi:microcystin-dependent protein